MGVAIRFRDTEGIVKEALLLSRQEPAKPYTLPAAETGMATGPRQRQRLLSRAGRLPDFIRPEAADLEAWQKLDDDIYRFVSQRALRLNEAEEPLSQQFLFEVECKLKARSPDYEVGAFLGLARMAADLDETRDTLVTASERGAFHAFGRRLAEGAARGERFDLEKVVHWQGLLELAGGDKAALHRAVADLFRTMGRAARLPLLGAVSESPAVAVSSLLRIVEIASRFNRGAGGVLQFQVTPLDVFLGARAVLHNRSMTQPSLSMLMDLVLSESGLYYDDLLDWLNDVGVFGSENTLQVPGALLSDRFRIRGREWGALDLVALGGKRLQGLRSHEVGPYFAALADGLLYKVQQQDFHKDRQVQGILHRFNGLLSRERRSASRVSEDRRKARFDYLEAIQKAGELVKELNAHAAPAPDAYPGGPDGPGHAVHSAATGNPRDTVNPEYTGNPADTGAAGEPGSEGGRAFLKRSFGMADYEPYLAGWDRLVMQVRQRLGSKSPTFKSLIAVLAQVRSLDTCMTHGLTPGGSRCLGRLTRLLPGEDMRLRLGFDTASWETVEAWAGGQSNAPGQPFLASLEALVRLLYGYPQDLKKVRFRLGDRLSPAGPADDEAGHDPGHEADGEADIDVTIVFLLVQSVLLAHRLAASASFDPFAVYCGFLAAAEERFGQAPLGDPETARVLFENPDADFQAAMASRILARDFESSASALLPSLGDQPLRVDWYRGFERGFMEEVAMVYEKAEEDGSLEKSLFALLQELQGFVEKLAVQVEGDKNRRVREQVERFLNPPGGR